MTEKLPVKLIFPLLIILTVLAIDQVSKSFVQGFFTVTCNTGIALGIWQNLTILILPVLLIAGWLAFSEEKFYKAIGLSLVFAGGLSNFVDRLTYGCVRDFISIGIFPSFNFADSAISAGVILILMTYIFADKSK